MMFSCRKMLTYICNYL